MWAEPTAKQKLVATQVTAPKLPYGGLEPTVQAFPFHCSISPERPTARHDVGDRHVTPVSVPFGTEGDDETDHTVPSQCSIKGEDAAEVAT